MTFVNEILRNMPGLNKPRRRFIQTLFMVLLAMPSRFNFRNVSRFGPFSEKTLARHFERHFDWAHFNHRLLEPIVGRDCVLAIDTSFITKSGKKTFGLDRFFDSKTSRHRTGLELSLVSLIDTDEAIAYPLLTKQTPAFETQKRSQRVGFYLDHLKQAQQASPREIKYVLADGHYAKKTFIEGISALGLDLITRLRSDANLRYLYTGPQSKGRGRRRQYSGKVDLKDPTGMQFVGFTEDDTPLALYTAVVNSPHFKCNLRMIYLLEPSSGRYVVLATTDLDIEANEVLRLYRLRFQIEFLFRDAKQHTGLMQVQARSQAKLDFHFNASLSALTVARRCHPAVDRRKSKQQRLNTAGSRRRAPFSMASVKRISFNELYLDRIIEHLALEPNTIKLHPAYQFLRTYGAIAA